jgi:ABC-2 type transport system permease protein
VSRRFSLARVGAVLMKELIHMRRDRLTFAMMVGVPIVQLILFGFAINTDPRSLPTAAPTRARPAPCWHAARRLSF